MPHAVRSRRTSVRPRALMTGAAVVLALVSFLAPQRLHAQAAAGWDASLMVDPFPPSYLSDWEQNPTLASLTISKDAAPDAWVTIHFTVADGDGRIVVSGRSDPHLVRPGAPTVLNTGAAIGGASEYDTEIEEVISRTGRFPEGDYTACVVLTDASGFVVADRMCADFSTFYPDPPFLLFPMDGDTVATPDLMFEWTPLQLPVQVTPRFVLQIAEILPGQAPIQALTANILHYENTNLVAPVFPYPIGALPLKLGQRYAWWVQAIDLNGLPLSTHDGRSEIWTFTPGGGDSPGEEIGGSTHARLSHAGRAGAGPLANLGTASYEAIRDALEDLADSEIRIPLPIPNVDRFEDLPLSNVQIEWDDASRAVAITATASLPFGSVKVLVLGVWESGETGTFTLGIDPISLDLSDWLPAGASSAEGIDLDGGIITIASSGRTLDPSMLPPSVQAFYGALPVPLEVGVSLHHVLDLRDSPLGRRLAELGVNAEQAELSGTIVLDPVALFGELSEAPAFDLEAILYDAQFAGTPEWVTVERLALHVVSDSALAIDVEMAVEAELPDRTLQFVLTAEVEHDAEANDVVFTGRMPTAWEAPLGIEWLTLDSVRLTLTPPQATQPARALLGALLLVGSTPVDLTVEVAETDDAMSAHLTAHVDELAVGDLVSFVESGFGAGAFGGAIPQDLVTLRDVHLELGSGDPPMLTVVATATALGQTTEIAYTLLPPGTIGDDAQGLFGIRLADWSLGGLIPSLRGTMADFQFPAVSFIQGPAGEPAPPASEPDGDDAVATAGWSIPWASVDPAFRDFLSTSYPCAGATGCASAEQDGASSALSLMPGLNFSAPISWTELSSAFQGLFGGSGNGGGGTGGGGGEEAAASVIAVQGSPGIALTDLFAGEFDVSALLDLRAVLPPIEDLPFGWPEWLVPIDQALEISGDPVHVVASLVLEADLDGPKTFDLAAELTGAEGGGAAFAGSMRGAWERPFGLEWLVLDSVNIALGAGSVGPRVALSSVLGIGSATAALAIDVRGTSENRVVDFAASARNLSTDDVVEFLNQAFDAGLAAPTSTITLDSLTVAFSTVDASFHLTGAFAADMEPVAALAALADLLPGVTAPTEVPFEIGTLASAWFDLHVVPDSVWGGYGGRVSAGDESSARFEGTAAIRIGASRTGGDDWLTLDLDLAAHDLSAREALDALASAVPGDWTIADGLDETIDVTLDSVRARMGLDTRIDSASAELAGAGRFQGAEGSLDASLELALFDVGDAKWAIGALTLELLDMPVSAVLAQAAAVLPGEWALPADLDALAPIRLDSASLVAGFDTRFDSLSARVRGAGTMGGADALAASADLLLTRVGQDSWAAGRLDARIGTMSIPDALAKAATLLPVENTIPDVMAGLTPLVLDSAVLGMAFDSRTRTFLTEMNGASHLGEGPTRLDGISWLSLLVVGDERSAEGEVTLDVRAVPITDLLAQAAEMLPGDWTLPDGFSALGELYLDSAQLVVGFDTRLDSLGAVARGTGHLGEGGGAMRATANIAFARVGEESGAAGAAELTRSQMTMTQALEQIAALLPGEWSLPDDMDAFDAVSLDTARLVIGFDTWVDSLSASVYGAGRFDDIAADLRLLFLHGADVDQASGLVTLTMGEVGAGEAIARIADLLPGEWDLPAGFTSFDALVLDSARLHAGFETASDSLWAGFQGAGRLNQLNADAVLGFGRVAGTTYGNGLVNLNLGQVSLDEAFGLVADLLPGDWSTPDVDFEIGSLERVHLELGFDTQADSVWAGVQALAMLRGREGKAELAMVSAGGASGAARTWVTGTFRQEIGDVTLSDAVELAASLVPGAPAAPQIDVDLGGISDAVIEAGFRTGAGDSAWAGLNGGFRVGQRTGRADVILALGEGPATGRLTAWFDDRFEVSDVLEMFAGLVPGAGIELPPLGPLDVGVDNALLVLSIGARAGVSFGGTTQLFGKDGDVLFSAARIDGRSQVFFGIQVPDLGFSDIVPGFENPLTDALRLDLAALTLTNATGSIASEDLTAEELRFFRPLNGGADDFTVDFRPGLNLTGLLPLADGPLKDMVGMLAPGASNLTLAGTLPLPGGGGGGLRSLDLSAALPPMSPPGAPAWFVEGQIAVAITGRPSVGVKGALTIDVDGDTLTFDIESNAAIVPAGIELSIAGGLAALNPWVGPLGIEWLTLNEIRLALGLSPIAVRLGFLGDAVIGTKDLRLALGTKLNLYTGVPMGAIVAGESEAGLSLADIVAFQQQVNGGSGAALPIEALPDMGIRELVFKVATYNDPDIDVTAGVTFEGTLMVQSGAGGAMNEFGRIELDIGREGITGLGRMDAFTLGPVAFDSAFIDLALTRADQHLNFQGGATILNTISAELALAMSRDSITFATELELFDQFRAELMATAGFDLTNPTFSVHAAMHTDFSDEVMFDLIGFVLPIGQGALTVAATTLAGAQEALNISEAALDGVIWAAGEIVRGTMIAAYAFYEQGVANYNAAYSTWAYYGARCSWYAPGMCVARDFWRGVLEVRRTQKNIRWVIYSGARSLYENREFLENNPLVQGARTALDNARAGVTSAQAAVTQAQTALTGLEQWMATVESCATCPRPPVPLNIKSATFDAALAGLFEGGSVDLELRYQVFGEDRVANASFGGSITDLVQPLISRVSDALF